MEINEVKIDRCFVSRLQHSVYNCRLIGNMIELSHSEQLRVCCEGVETEEELAVLRTLHPDLLQGYLFSKPYEAETFARYYIRETVKNTVNGKHTEKDCINFPAEKNAGDAGTGM